MKAFDVLWELQKSLPYVERNDPDRAAKLAASHCLRNAAIHTHPLLAAVLATQGTPDRWPSQLWEAI